jgi:hypothetical protein
VRQKRKLLLYLDGVLVAEDSTAAVYNVDTNIPLVLGAIHKGGLSPINEYMDGRIDEVRIWNRALSEFEIDTKKNCAIIAPETNLLGVYNLNETAGSSANDASGNINEGSLVGFPAWSNSTVAPLCVLDMNESVVDHLVVYPNPFQNEIFLKNAAPDSKFRIFFYGG